MSDNTNVMTPVGMLYFPEFFTPKGNKNNPAAAPQYAGCLLLNEIATNTEAYMDMRRAVKAAIEAKFGQAKAADQNFLSSLRSPFRQASEKAGETGYPGFEDGEVWFRAWRKEDFDAPGVVDLHGTDIVVPGDVWTGQLARFTLRAFAWENSGNRGVSFGLDHVQIIKRDMPKLKVASAGAAFNGVDAGGQDLTGYGVSDLAASAPADNGSDDLPF